MATYVSGYIQDLSAVKDNIKLRVRILRTWMQPVYGKPHVINMEMIIMDEQNNKMQATIRMALINGFKHQLEEGNAVTLQRYSLGEIKPQYRMVKQGLRLSFLSNTLVEKCADFTGSIHGFEFRPFNSIIDLLDEEVGQFDVIGQVVACGELDNYDKNGKPGKKKPITLIDAEGTELNATLWGSYAEQFSEFLTSSTDHGKIIAVIQLAMMKLWDKKMCVQNAYWGTKLFLLNGTDAISSPEFKDIEDFRKRLLENQQTDKSENVASRISTASKNSTKDEFVGKFPMKNIAELLDVGQGVTCVIVGTICAIQEEEGWWYIGCRGCKKKVVKSSDIVDLDSDTPPKPDGGGPTDWYCTKCKVNVSSVKTVFRLQVRVQDETGTISLSLFNDEVQAVVGRSAYQLVDKYGKSEENGVFPHEITAVVGKKYAFKVSMDEINAKKLLPVFNVWKLTDDPAILETLRECATPIKPDNEATSKSVPKVTPLDLESQTDENTTPVTSIKTNAITPNIQENSKKRGADDEPGSESSNGKKQFVAVKVEKDP